MALWTARRPDAWSLPSYRRCLLAAPVYAKARNVPEEHAGELGYGDTWTWVAIDAGTKLVPAWAIGRRDAFTGNGCIQDVASQLATRVQMTTDGHKVYREAIEGAFGANIDYARVTQRG